MSVQSQVDGIEEPQLQVRTVAALRPLSWLRDGWADLARHKAASIAHGLLITGLGLVILMFATTHVYLMAAAISGFLLVGPIMATGLCELSRRRQRGESVSFDESLDALSRSGTALWHFAASLLGISLLWFLLSALVLQTVAGQPAPAFSAALWGDLLAMLSPQQLVVYIAVGGILAALVFLVSVVSIPAIIDRSISATTAMRISLHTVAANIPAMLVWAALIVALTAIGFATLLLGMIIIYPLLGHATWHAYRELVQ
ncbi:putative membrane protein [Methylohalomonas lacus]|uniref:Membrane protein n=1 Tax=Methylohalomonas lacus TaxID=398773 RepID=A0AAE3L171_9GAMM|nr:DUF2189 domain-containing protein [Methylohalomonas lacus]MCS3903579.1 putative membrane protein [Methylohalomonas lacus]